MAIDYLVFGQNLCHHSYFVGATDATQSVASVSGVSVTDLEIQSKRPRIRRRYRATRK